MLLLLKYQIKTAPIPTYLVMKVFIGNSFQPADSVIYVQILI